MTIDERIEALTMDLELVSRDIETLRDTAQDQGKRIEMLITAAEKDGENIRALARIADMHDRRLTNLEGPNR
jgi:archaellum component FlaC